MKTKSTRRLRARAAAMSSNDSEFDDYGPEPNMKLSHAFLVVLLLHVIAVGGLYAFNTMKAGKSSQLAVAKATAPSHQQAGSPPDTGFSEQDSNSEDPKKEPSTKEKTPLVAKTSDDSKVTESPENSSSENAPDPKPHRGLLEIIKTSIMHLMGGGVATTSLAIASAQETPDPRATAQPSQPAINGVAGQKTYVVKAGDTITKISSLLGVAILDLEKANGLVGNAVLRVGETLQVPEKIVVPAPTEASNQSPQVAGGEEQPTAAVTSATAASMSEYTVVKGDNPYKIAKKFRITTDELMKANGITDPRKIQIGQKLKVPASTKKGAKKTTAIQ